MGVGISVKAAPQALAAGAGTITLICCLSPSALAWRGYLFGAEGIFCLSGVAIIAAMYTRMATLCCAGRHSGNERDVGAISILSLNDGPFFTMIALGAAGWRTFPLWRWWRWFRLSA